MKRFMVAVLFVMFAFMPLLLVGCGSSAISQVESRISQQYVSLNSAMGQVKINSGKSTVTAVANVGYKFVGWNDGVRENERTIERQKDKNPIVAIFEIQALDMPVFCIDTNGEKITSKQDYVAGQLDILNTEEQYLLNDCSLQIRLRGNSTFNMEKKSYRIKFDKKYNPLGQGNGKAKSWTLLAVHCDKSLLRTDAAFYFASYLNNIPFVSSSGFVELYLNGEYQGVYNLCDQIQVNEKRVDIDDTGLAEDIGFLVELANGTGEQDFTLISGDNIEIKSEYSTDEQFLFIKNFLQECENALQSGDKTKVENLIDINSAVDCYIVEELTKNWDVGWGSFFYSRQKGGKLQFGPVWDFDSSLANVSYGDYEQFLSYEYTFVGNREMSNLIVECYPHRWYSYLRDCDWFNDMVSIRWQQVVVYAN